MDYKKILIALILSVAVLSYLLIEGSSRTINTNSLIAIASVYSILFIIYYLIIDIYQKE